MGVTFNEDNVQRENSREPARRFCRKGERWPRRRQARLRRPFSRAWLLLIAAATFLNVSPRVSPFFRSMCFFHARRRGEIYRSGRERRAPPPDISRSLAEAVAPSRTTLASRWSKEITPNRKYWSGLNAQWSLNVKKRISSDVVLTNIRKARLFHCRQKDSRIYDRDKSFPQSFL